MKEQGQNAPCPGRKASGAAPDAFLREAREKAGYTQQLVAEELGISQATLSNLENGQFTGRNGSLKKYTTSHIHALAELYRRPDVEEHFCSSLCPIGQCRQQLQYRSFTEIREKLNASLDQLERNSDLISDTMSDASISDAEWQYWPRLLTNLREISALIKSADLWAKKKQKQVPPTNAGMFNVPHPYKTDRQKRFDRTEACAATGIERTRLGTIERQENREIPKVHEAISMSRAYLSPRIRNFYCYHDCEIGGTLEPLDIHDPARVALALISSLRYVADMKEQFNFALQMSGMDDPDPAGMQQTLDKLNTLSREVDSVILLTEQTLCGRLLEMLEDQRIDDDERPDFIRVIGYLREIGANPEMLEEMQKYLTD